MEQGVLPNLLCAKQNGGLPIDHQLLAWRLPKFPKTSRCVVCFSKHSAVPSLVRLLKGPSEHKTDMAPYSEFRDQKRTAQGSLSLYVMIYVLGADHSTQRASLEVHLQGMGSLESSLSTAASRCSAKARRARSYACGRLWSSPCITERTLELRITASRSLQPSLVGLQLRPSLAPTRRSVALP